MAENNFIRMSQQDFTRKLSYEVLSRLPEYSKLSVKPINTAEESSTVFILSLPEGTEVTFCVENLYLAYLERKGIRPVADQVVEIAIKQMMEGLDR